MPVPVIAQYSFGKHRVGFLFLLFVLLIGGWAQCGINFIRRREYLSGFPAMYHGGIFFSISYCLPVPMLLPYFIHCDVKLFNGKLLIGCKFLVETLKKGCIVAFSMIFFLDWV